MTHTYMILGGGGSFGLHTADYLLKQPDTDRVVCVGRSPPKAVPFHDAIVDVKSPKFTYITRRIDDTSGMLLLFDEYRPDIVVNFAAQGEGAVSWTNSWRFFDTNASALARLVEEINKLPVGLKRWVQIGTSELYGSVLAPAHENYPLTPTSPYAASKAAADMYLLALAKSSLFPAVILRPSNCYGPGQLLHRVIPRAVVCGLTGQKLPLQGGGTARKSYMHTRDLARAVHLVACDKVAIGSVYNAGPLTPISISGLLNIVADELGMPFAELVEPVPARHGEDSCYWLDSSKIEFDLDWVVTVPLVDGIREVVTWGRQYLSELRKAPQTYTFRR